MKTLTRRNVIASFSASSVLLCPAILNAQTDTFDWGEDVPTDKPLNEDRLVEVAAGEPVDITDLGAGEVAVLAMAVNTEDFANTGGMHYVAVMRRTADQIAFAQANPPAKPDADARFTVVSLSCPHRGYAVGMTGDANAPFACTKRGNRHSSVFNSVGLGVDGKSTGEYMTVPAHSLEVAGEGDAITNATLTLA